MTQEELNNIEKKALEQVTTRKSLFGKDDAFAPLLRNFLDKALEAWRPILTKTSVPTATSATARATRPPKRGSAPLT